MHADFDRDLIELTKPFTKEDRRKSWVLFLSTVFLVLISFSATFLMPVPILIPFGILTGLFLGRLFVIYHDYNHKAILTKSVIADVLMKIFGLFILAPASIWNQVHDYHHDHNSRFTDIVMGSFPILEKAKFNSLPRLAKFKYLLIRHPATIALSYLSVFIISFCLYPFFENPRKHWDGLLSFILHVIISVAILSVGGIEMWFFGLILPFLIMGALGGYVFYAQHNFPGVKLMNNEEWNYKQAALKSSSFIKMNSFWRWVTANVGYHHIHHINSRIPFYRLPEAMKSIPALQDPTITSLAFKDVKACLALKLWDEETGDLIGIS